MVKGNVSILSQDPDLLFILALLPCYGPSLQLSLKKSMFHASLIFFLQTPVINHRISELSISNHVRRVSISCISTNTCLFFPISEHVLESQAQNIPQMYKWLLSILNPRIPAINAIVRMIFLSLFLSLSFDREIAAPVLNASHSLILCSPNLEALSAPWKFPSCTRECLLSSVTNVPEKTTCLVLLWSFIV